MSWILLTVGAQFINAFVVILDKYILCSERAMPRPFVYAFYSCIMTGSWAIVFLLTFIPGLADLGLPHLENVQRPTIQVVAMSFLAAYTFFMAIVSLYDALKRADASDVMPVIGAVSAMSTFGMSYFFFDFSLTPNYIWGIALLATGTLLVSQGRFRLKTAINTIHSGLFFALHYITMKGLFLETSFDDGFFWSRVCFVLFGLSLLLVPVYWQKISDQTKESGTRGFGIVILAKVLAGIAAFMLLKATDIGDVAVVQALDGLKFVFILALGAFIGRYIPVCAGEAGATPDTLLRKIAYIAIISIGFVILFT